MSTLSTSTGVEDKKKRNPKETCRKKIEKQFKSDAFFQFLQQKYAGNNNSNNWWQAVGLGFDHVLYWFGTIHVHNPDVIKKAFSDAILSSDAEAGRNPDCVLAPRHMRRLRSEVRITDIPLQEYARLGYRIGADGMIEKIQSALKRQKSPSTVGQGGVKDGPPSKKARSSSPKSAPRVVIDLTDD